jgi:Contractile injection system tube protein/LysM domain
MEFKKATIEPQGKSTINVLFNPNSYTVDKSNQIAEAAIPGLQAPILQYVHGNTRSLNMELFFDTYEEQTDVRDYTAKIYDLLEIDADTHVPPICRITWGGFTFRGVMEHVSGRFSLFLPDGTPARANLTVTFKEYIEVEVLVKENPTQSADHRKTRLVRRGDRLPSIAFEEYADASKWRPIADANGIDDPNRLVVGARLVIPALDPMRQNGRA